MIGVYLIRNVANGMFYIGSSVNINDRFSTHISKLKSNMNQNKKMQIDFNLFGRESFVLEILEECCVSELRQKEHEYILKLKPTYNVFLPDSTGLNKTYIGEMTPKKIKLKREKERKEKIKQERKITGESPYGIEFSKMMSEKTKKHWDSLSEEERRLKNKYKFGRVFSEETKQKLREAKLGRKLTEETKLKIKNALKGKKKA